MTASPDVSLKLNFTDLCGPIVANFSNDNITFGADVIYDSASPQISWSLPNFNGVHTVYGRVRDGAGNTLVLASQSVELDQSAPTQPGAPTATCSINGNDRTVTMSWSPAFDFEGNLRGYRIYRSTDGVSWNLLDTTASNTYSDTHLKGISSVRFYLTSYDKAGNESYGTPLPVFSYGKNSCS